MVSPYQLDQNIMVMRQRIEAAAAADYRGLVKISNDATWQWSSITSFLMAFGNDFQNKCRSSIVVISGDELFQLHGVYFVRRCFPRIYIRQKLTANQSENLERQSP